ncbi:adenylylsulfate kinase [Desulfofarcimen acetoxidans DSM 771]|uniref:Adenylyl-sulfate kinase n=1 Tax=Desulfofarcimen acetoxidans (strain ATCC 49208 / DSM 771 / KCTC 5769 / VKM B-1644 / 5575) TaxID=485916 RepID=C8VYT1_DESAS|nr:adenylyl-sulfate kinase [Desulfofarcimen acetoxidans]ACV64802.1 adenylylsulfate kinase [Desulfofarcimen acetoxidans DSM 771]
MYQGFTVWFTGMSGAGKTTLGEKLVKELRFRGFKADGLDGDVVRQGLCRDLGFSVEDREKNIRCMAFAAQILNRNGICAIASFITPYNSMRRFCREQISRYVEIYVRCPLETLIRRDVKGLYKKALSGELPAFTGISDPFEEPETPDLVVDTSCETPEKSLAKVIYMLEMKGFLEKEVAKD